MKVTSAQLDHLLELNNIDQLLVTTQKQLIQLSNDSEASSLQAELTQAATFFLEASKAVEALELELKRNNEDLQLVEQREARDRERLLAASNPKDISGLQNELATLAKRRSDLEDASLELMEATSQAVFAQKAAKDDRLEVQQRADKYAQAMQIEAMKMQSSIELHKQDRLRVVGLLTSELMAIYEQKRSRGTAVGLLAGPTCGACRMAISASEYSQLLVQPPDEMITCPECSAVLVRR